MKLEYGENEIKILGIEVEKLTARLEALGAKQLFKGKRVITTFDTPEGNYRKQDKIIRITQEGTTKVTMHVHNSQLDKNKLSNIK